MSEASQCTPTVQVHSDQGVLRSFVHKRSHDNVLLTGISQYTIDRFICTGRLPIDHRFFNSPGRMPSRDILFYTEVGRQASIALSHAFLDVPTDDVFIFEGSHATITEPAWRAGQGALDPVVMDITIREIRRRKNNAVSRVVADHRMSLAGELVFFGTGAWTVQAAALFRRLRGASAIGPAIAPLWFTRRPSTDVITEPTRINGSFAASLIVDETHPYFFDHPCDHVPGMLLLEGCAQLAVSAFAQTTSVSAARSRVSDYEVNFAQFVERGLPTTLTAHVNAEDDVEIAISQADALCGTTKMRVAFPV